MQFLAPVVAAPALIFIGILMISSLKDIELDDITELLPAALTVLLIPLTSGIETGIAFGLISHVLIKTLTFKFKDISILEIILAALFVIKFIVG